MQHSECRTIKCQCLYRVVCGWKASNFKLRVKILNVFKMQLHFIAVFRKVTWYLYRFCANTIILIMKRAGMSMLL